jgi:hypothetical protein
MGVIFKSSAAGRRVEGRKIEFTFSTPDYDRENDRILGPWNLTAFRANPICLFSHQYSQPPIGRCTKVGMVDGELVGTIEFMDASIYPFADQVFQMLCGRWMSAVSVGLLALTPPKSNSRGGQDYLEVELLEISVTGVPANAEALARALNSQSLVPQIGASAYEAIKDVVALVATLDEAGDYTRLEELLKGVALVNEPLFLALVESIPTVYGAEAAKASKSQSALATQACQLASGLIVAGGEGERELVKFLSTLAPAELKVVSDMADAGELDEVLR